MPISLRQQELRLFRINILSNMRNGDDYQFLTDRGFLWVKYERNSLFQAGEWICKWYRTSDIEEILSILEDDKKE